MAIGAALKSFLTSHPNKKINCLRYICIKLSLPLGLTVELLRNEICEYANKNNVEPDQIKQIAEYFHANEDECVTLINDLQVQSPLNSSHRISATDSDLADIDIRDNQDELESEDDDDTSSTITEDETFRTGQDISTAEHENSFSQKVRNLLMNSANQTVVLSRSQNQVNNNRETSEIASESRSDAENSESQSAHNTTFETQPKSALEQMLTTICSNLVNQVTSAKDAEINELKIQNAGLTEVNETLSKNCSIILKRYERLAETTNEVKEMASNIQDLKTAVSDLTGKVNGISCSGNHSSGTSETWQKKLAIWRIQ